MLSSEEKIIIIGFAAAFFLLLVVGYFVYTFIEQHKKIVAWQQERIKAEVEILETERKRIATDLHDEVGPLLSVIKVQMNQLNAENDFEEMLLNKNNKQIDEVIQKFRNISYNLLPNTLVRKGVVYATQEFIDKIDNTQLKINFRSDGVQLNTNTAVNIFRIIQEIVHNTIKHARATTLDIAILDLNKSIDISTKDNGIGFIYNEKEKINNGLGLLSLQSRVEIMNGTIKIETSTGNGVRYLISIPKQPKEINK